MPTFNVPVDDVSFDFEVYCATCGAGMCNETEVSTTRTRSVPCIRVNACQRCIDAAVKDAIANYEES